MFTEAEHTDQAEDDQFGSGRGDELPAKLRGRADRQRRLDAAAAQIEARQKAETQTTQGRKDRVAKAAEQGRRVVGRKPKSSEPVTEAETELKIARMEAERRQAERAATEKAAAERGRRPGGPKPTAAEAKVAKAEQKLREAREQAATTLVTQSGEQHRANISDPDSRMMKVRGGFIQGYNAQAAVNENQIVLAAELTNETNDVGQYKPMTSAVTTNLAAVGITDPIGMMLFDAGYWSQDNATAKGPPRLIATGKASKLRRAIRTQGHTNGPPPNDDATPTETMDHRLRTPDGAALYAKRATTVEPVFGQHKEARGYRRLIRRGLNAAQAEWALINTTHNILKLHTHTT